MLTVPWLVMCLTGKSKPFLLISAAFFLSLKTVNAELVTKEFVEYRNDLVITSTYTADRNKESPEYKKYYELKESMPSPRIPNARIAERSVGANGTIEYTKIYTIDKLGFRVSPVKKAAALNLIVAGDSNIFGLGSNDDETLTAKLSAKLANAQLFNLGISAGSPSSHLFFLQHHSFNEILHESKAPATFIYDFSFYIFERIIGSKNFISWGEKHPSYKINGKGKVIYAGPFKDQTLTKFYQLLNYVDPDGKLIKNLPRLNEDHLVLTVKIFSELKKQFLAQTHPANSFIIAMNPFFMNASEKEVMKRFKELLKEAGIKVVEFDEIKNSADYIYKRDGHMTPSGHNLYSQMITKLIAAPQYQ